jgi:hypothetical protein
VIKLFSNSITYLWELITNQKNKKIKEIQLQRDQNKAFIAYEKVSKTIESVIHEEHIEQCYWMASKFCIDFKNVELHKKLLREIEVKLKSLNSTFH